MKNRPRTYSVSIDILPRNRFATSRIKLLKKHFKRAMYKSRSDPGHYGISYAFPILDGRDYMKPYMIFKPIIEAMQMKWEWDNRDPYPKVTWPADMSFDLGLFTVMCVRWEDTSFFITDKIY